MSLTKVLAYIVRERSLLTRLFSLSIVSDPVSLQQASMLAQAL